MLGYIKSRPPNILFLGGFAGGVGSNLAWVMTMMTLAMIMMLTAITIIIQMMMTIRERCKKKLTNVSFMYVCVAGNGEMLVFFSFFPPTIV